MPPDESHREPFHEPKRESLDPIPVESADHPKSPSLPGTVVVRPTVEDLIDSIAADLFFQATACVREFGDFHIALSGGTTPEPLYRRLMYDPAYRQLPWRRAHLWVVDERRVPFDDPRSNFRMIRETIADHADIPPDQVHPIFATAADAARDYEEKLHSAFVWRQRGHGRLDYVLLGLGEDGHTASLFPFSPALAEHERLVVENAGPRVAPPARITMTFPLLNAARFLAVMVTGERKRPAVQRLARANSSGGQVGVEELPALGLHPVAGELRWYLDHAACPDPAG